LLRRFAKAIGQFMASIGLTVGGFKDCSGLPTLVNQSTSNWSKYARGAIYVAAVGWLFGF